MKKKKLNQLHLKKTIISRFTEGVKGGQPLGDQQLIVTLQCTIYCSINCPTLFNCPTLDRINCPDSIRICVA
ncbi:hypothetical protein [Ascidiimonas aurantiaca]|uniref:hypothetical protein n=1 Tax=Ascidiimonas aurantiaca TaxID=1685432 RepID=UPI0030EE4157